MLKTIDPQMINGFLNQPGRVILPLLAIGWVSSAWGIYRANQSLTSLVMGGMAASSRPCLDELKSSVIFAWPIYWLLLFFALLNRDLAWSACLTMLPTLLVLPAALAGLRLGKIQYQYNAASAGFLALALLVLCGSGIGMDREFTRLGGHFIFTVFLLYLWWEWPIPKSQDELPFPAPSNTGLFGPMVLYHLGAAILLLASYMIHVRYQFHAGLILGLLIGLAWTPGLTRVLLTEPRPGTLIASLPLAIIFLIVPPVLIFGPVDFPITLWQMELCTSLLLAVLWVGLGLIGQPLAKLENLLLLAVYLIYLALRLLRLFS